MNKTSYLPQKGSNLKPSLSKARLGLDIEPQDFNESSEHLADMKGYLFFPNRSRPKISQVNLRKTNDTSKSPEDDRYRLLQGSNNTSLGESSTFGFQSTCESSQRKPTQKLAYTNKLKNQRKLNEIYSSERLTTNTHFFSFGLNPRKSRINDQGLGIGTEVKEPMKNLSMISPSNLISASSSTTLKAWKPSDLNSNHRRIKSKTEKFVGQSLSEVDCEQAGSKDRFATYESQMKTRGSSFQKAERSESIVLLKDKEEKEIKDVNDKIRNTIQNSLNISPNASPFTRTNFSPNMSPEDLNRTKANMTRKTTDKTSILVLFDQDLDFIKDYLIEYQLTLKLVFDKLENYESPTYKKTGDRQTSPLKRGIYLPYHCIFVFLKCSPKVNSRSFAILEELMRVKCCFIIKCCFPSEVGKVNFTYKYEDATAEWRRKFEYTLIMMPGRFGTYSINYNYFYVLKEFILANSKFYLTKDS